MSADRRKNRLFQAGLVALPSGKLAAYGHQKDGLHAMTIYKLDDKTGQVKPVQLRLKVAQKG